LIHYLAITHLNLFCWCVAGVTWDDLGVGFNSTPGGQQWANKSVLAYHYYIPPQLSLNGTFAIRMLDIERLQCGAFLTEFDADNLTVAIHVSSCPHQFPTHSSNSYDDYLV
jgi:hypothetical protein